MVSLSSSPLYDQSIVSLPADTALELLNQPG